MLSEPSTAKLFLVMYLRRFRFSNTTHENFNFTLHTTLGVTTRLMLPTPAKPILPVQTGEQAQQEEQSSGMTIFFSLLVLAICIILVHLLIRYRLHFLPESVAVVSLGILMGAVIKIIEFKKLANWKEEEMFRPNMFFLLLLPPIIFESGYSLHKGNFFQNIGSITLFAVFGTAISAFVVGGGIYFLGQGAAAWAAASQKAPDIEFQKDPSPVQLRSLDCALLCVPVSILSTYQWPSGELRKKAKYFAFGSLISAVDPVATIAIFNALHVDPVLNMLVFGESILNDAVSIVLTKAAPEDITFALTSEPQKPPGQHIDLRRTPSLEFGMMIIFAYLPYGLAEGISLSGIMAILFSGIVMSHYTHHNLSPVTQILMQQTLRTVAFLCGLRGAIPYALSLHLGLEPMEKRQLIGTTTIVIVLFTILLLGGSTMPLIRLVDIEDARARRRNKKDVNLSKTEKMGNAIESEHLSELTEEEYEAHYIRQQDLKGFMWLDAKYLNPFFTRRLTQEDLHHGRIQMKSLTNKWYEEVRQGPSGSEDDEQELF
ncbi:hypothetical protein ACRRTK_013204 [Alexandromys fortis]